MIWMQMVVVWIRVEQRNGEKVTEWIISKVESIGLTNELDMEKEGGI